MARPLEGFKVIARKGEGNYRAVFTANGEQKKPSTGIKVGEPGAYERAMRVAAQLYAAAISGVEPGGDRKANVASGAPSGPTRPLVEAGDEWLTAVIGSVVRVKTAGLYELHIRAHLAPFFDPRGGLDGITRDSTKAYLQHRLRSVEAKTVRKELSTLRGLLAHHGLDAEALVVSVPTKAKGTAHRLGKRTATPLEAQDAMAVLRRLPARDRFGQVVRLRYYFAYEMTLRPATLSGLSVPEHWVAGQHHVLVTRDIDKMGFERRVPLPRGARLVLHILTNGGRARGPIFPGNPDHRDSLKKAAKAAVGERGGTMQRYDLRRNGITRVIAETTDDPLRAAQWMAGHTQISTTAIYAQTSEGAATAAMKGRKAIRAAALKPTARSGKKQAVADSKSRMIPAGAKGGT